MPKIQKRTLKNKKGTSESYFVTIPLELIDKIKWQKGETVLWQMIDNNTLQLQRVEEQT